MAQPGGLRPIRGYGTRPHPGGAKGLARKPRRAGPRRTPFPRIRPRRPTPHRAAPCPWPRPPAPTAWAVQGRRAEGPVRRRARAPRPRTPRVPPHRRTRAPATPAPPERATRADRGSRPAGRRPAAPSRTGPQATRPMVTYTTSPPGDRQPLTPWGDMGRNSHSGRPDPYTRSSDRARGRREDEPPVMSADRTGRPGRARRKGLGWTGVHSLVPDSRPGVKHPGSARGSSAARPAFPSADRAEQHMR